MRGSRRGVRLFRVILPVGDIDAATTFWSAVLGGAEGERVTAGRHYFDCGGTLLACWDPPTRATRGATGSASWWPAPSTAAARSTSPVGRASAART